MSKRRGCGCSTVFIIACFAILLLILFFMGKDKILATIYPLDYEPEVFAICDEYGLDPWLIMAVIREESAFDPKAESPVGACGLMQLMPDTAYWVIDKAGFDYAEDIWQPETNIRLGVWYLAWLMERYANNHTLALAAYNAGHTAVSRWLEEGDWDGSPDALEDVPYGETRHYIEKVLRSYRIYRFLYD